MSGKQKILKFCLLLLLLFRKGKIVESTKFDGLAPQMELKLEKQNLKVFFTRFLQRRKFRQKTILLKLFSVVSKREISRTNVFKWSIMKRDTSDILSIQL
jgi:hypothetical protein